MNEARAVPQSESHVAAILPQHVTWDAGSSASQIASLSNRPAVFLLVSADGAPVQLAITQQLRAAITARLSEPAESRERRADLAAVVRGVRYAEARDAIEARLIHWRVARTVFPRAYREQLAFGPADFLAIDWSASIPEPRVTQQPYAGGEFVGPFPTRAAAQEALEGLWDLFDLCRYPEQVRRAPHGVRCAYADMGRCDAPCDGSVAPAVYHARLRAAWEFACGGRSAWIEAAADRMRDEARGLRFERAGLLKQQIAFAERWGREWALARPLQRGAYLVVTPVTRRKGWSAYLFRAGEFLAGEAQRERDAPRAIAAWALAEWNRAPCETVEAAGANEQAGLLGYVLFSGIAARCAAAWIDEASNTDDVERELSRRLAEIRAKPEPVAEAPSENSEPQP